MFIFPLETLPYYQNHAFKDGIFSPEECDTLISLLDRLPPKEAVVRNQGEMEYNPTTRRSEVSWLHWNQESDAIYQRVAAAVLQCNRAIYNYHLVGLTEAMQLARYREGGFFEWHQDFSYGELSIRKLSFVVQLSDPGEYTGGDLEFMTDKDVKQSPRTRGAMIIFPSYVVHRVTPLTAGVRHSLVGWVSGPPFR